MGGMLREALQSLWLRVVAPCFGYFAFHPLSVVDRSRVVSLYIALRWVVYAYDVPLLVRCPQNEAAKALMIPLGLSQLIQGFIIFIHCLRNIIYNVHSMSCIVPYEQEHDRVCGVLYACCHMTDDWCFAFVVMYVAASHHSVRKIMAYIQQVAYILHHHVHGLDFMNFVNSR